MNEGSGVLVFWILFPLFGAVGLYLIWYSQRRKKMLESFAKTNQFIFRPERENALQKTLDSCFSLKQEGIVRSFGQISSLVEKESINFFRTIELLDLNSHARSPNTHFTRIAALFKIPDAYEEFFVLDKSMQASRRILATRPINPNVIEKSKQIAAHCKTRHALSVTLGSGYGLIYFEPLVTGGETMSDVNCLYCFASSMQKALSETEIMR